jgi:DNA invertase Pin-like site-specific DNA recombinase
MLIGYARVSTDDQKLNLQQDALQKAGYVKIFEDYLGDAKREQRSKHYTKGNWMQRDVRS